MAWWSWSTIWGRFIDFTLSNSYSAAEHTVLIYTFSYRKGRCKCTIWEKICAHVTTVCCQTTDSIRKMICKFWAVLQNGVLWVLKVCWPDLWWKYYLTKTTWQSEWLTIMFSAAVRAQQSFANCLGMHFLLISIIWLLFEMSKLVTNSNLIDKHNIYPSTSNQSR